MASAETSELRWEHFPHEADVGVRGMGPTPAAAFEQGALALAAVVTDPESIRHTQTVPIECRAADLESLFVTWLNALVFEMATRRMVFSSHAVTIDGTRLTGTATGEEVDVARHQPRVEVKGATYTELCVDQQNGAWRAQCVVDV